MTFAEDLALCEGMRGGPRRRHSFKRYSPGERGITVRLFSWLKLESGREWVMTAKRLPGGLWGRAAGVRKLAVD